MTSALIRDEKLINFCMQVATADLVSDLVLRVQERTNNAMYRGFVLMTHCANSNSQLQ